MFGYGVMYPAGTFPLEVSSLLANAVDMTLDNGMPVAVFNSGYELATRDSLVFFGMDESKGGYAAGQELARWLMSTYRVLILFYCGMLILTSQSVALLQY